MKILLGLFTSFVLGCGAPSVGDPPPPSGTAPPVDEPMEGAPPGSSSTAPPPGKETTPPAPLPKPTTDLYVHTFGKPTDPPVVFLHGGPGANSFAFEGAAAADLAARGYFVVAYDQRGSGRSPSGTAPTDYSYDRATRDLADVIGSLDLKKPVLLSHSFGGSIALRFLETRPDVARGIILVGSPINFPETYFTILEHSLVAYRKWWTPRGDSDKAREIETLKQRMFPNGLTGPFTYSAEDIGTTAQHMDTAGLVYPSVPSLDSISVVAKLKLDPGSALLTSINGAVGTGFHTNDKVGYADFTPLLLKYRADVYGIYGTDDGIFDAHQLGTVQTTLPSGHFTMLEGSGHFPFIDERAAFVNAVATHLGSLKP